MAGKKKQARVKISLFGRLRREYQLLEKPSGRELFALSGMVFGIAVVSAVCIRGVDMLFGLLLTGVLSLF